MGSFKLGKMTMRSLMSTPETVMYPIQTRPAPEGLKGHVANDMNACVLCGVCAKRCPTEAINVVKQDEMWSIDRFLCVQCGSCVRECPKQCLTMEPTYARAAQTKSLVILRKPEPSEEEKAAAAAKAAEREARKAAAKARREAEAAQA